MAIVDPPPPLSKKEFEKRIKNGARTFEEIDPEFIKWYNESGKVDFFCVAAFILGFLVVFVVVTLALWRVLAV